MIKLTPCLGCGAPGEVFKTTHEGRAVWRARCTNPNCCASDPDVGSDFDTPEEAAQAWNGEEEDEYSDSAMRRKLLEILGVLRRYS